MKLINFNRVIESYYQTFSSTQYCRMANIIQLNLYLNFIIFGVSVAMKKIHKVLESKLSNSTVKIKQIIKEGNISDSYKSDFAQSSSPNNPLQAKGYLNLAKRVDFLYKSKKRSYEQQFLQKIRQKSTKQRQKQKYFGQLMNFFFKQVILRNEVYGFNKLSLNRVVNKSKQMRKKHALNLLSSTFHHQALRNKNSAFISIRIKIYYQGIDNIKSKQSKSQMQKTPKQHITQASEQLIQTNLLSPLNQLLTYERDNFVQLTLSQLRSPLQKQVSKFEYVKNLNGKQLLLVVLNNHIKAIIDLTNNGSVLGVAANRRSFNQKITVGMYQELGNEFFESDQQLNKLIVISNDLPRAQGVIQLAIKNYTNRNYRFKNNKIIQSRVKLLELILALLRFSNEHQRVQYQIPPLPQLRAQKTSFHQLQVSYVRLIVEELDQKVYQLSTISEQIPQLETFKRTLDLTMPQHNVYLARIVDVLIELHHKINKLISRRPQKLLRQIQAVQQQCLIIQIATNQFLQKLQSQQQVKIKPIYFDQRNNKSPDYFRKIQKNIVRLSEFILQCLDLQCQARYKIDQIKSLVQVFWNLISGVQQYQREWIMYKNRDNKSADQQQIIQLLQLCLKFVNDRIDKMNEQFDIQRQGLIDGNSKNIQFLQQDIAKMSRQNDQLRTILQQLQKQNQQLRGDYGDYQQKYKDLLRKYEQDVNDYISKISSLQKKEKNYKDRIQSLQSQNEQKKVMIANITNDLKRAMKQGQNSVKYETKIRTFQQTIDKLTIKIETYEVEMKNLSQDNKIIARQRQQLEKNNQLIILKLDEANRRITDLQNQIDNIQHKYQRQKTSLKDQIEQLERKIRKLNQQLITNTDTRTKQYEKKDTEYRQAINKKDQKISELNNKILQLNSRLNQILDNHRNFEFQLKRKERNLQDLQTRLKQTEGKKSVDYAELLRNYQISQKQLNIALEQIQRTNKIIVPELQKQLKKRQQIISQLQKTIIQLEERQSQTFNNQQRARNLLQEAQQKLRNKQRQLNNKIKQLEALGREKDVKIRQLEFTININNSRINQLQSQGRMGTQDKNRLIKQLEAKAGQNQNDARRLRQLESKLSNYERDTRKIIQLEGKLLASDKDRIRLQELQAKLVGSQRDRVRLLQLQAKNQRDKNRIQELQSKILENDRDRHRILQLQAKLSAYDRDRQRLLQLESKLVASQRDRLRVQQLEAKLALYERERLRFQDLQTKFSASQRERLRLQDLQGRLSSNSEKERLRFQQLQAKLSDYENNRIRLQDLEGKLSISQRERLRLQDLQGKLSSINERDRLRLQEFESRLVSYDKDRSRLQELQSKVPGNERDRQRLIQLQNKLSGSQRDKLRLQELQAKLSGSERDKQRLQELESKLASSQRDRLRLQQLETKLLNSEKDKQRLHELQTKLSGSERDRQRLIQLQGKNSGYEKDRQRLIQLQNRLLGSQRDRLRLQELQAKLSGSERDRSKIQELENKLAVSERQRQRLRQIQLKIPFYQQQIRNYKNSEGQILRIRNDYQKRLKDLDFCLKDALGKLQRTTNIQQRQRIAQNKIIQLQSQLRRVKQQLTRLKYAQSNRSDQNNKINSLQAVINQKNRLIMQLQSKIRILQLQIKQLQKQSQKSARLIDQLRTKQRNLQASRVNQGKLAQNARQIQYLKEKIRNLQDLVDVFTEQHGILEAKIKQYRLRDNSNRDSSASSSVTTTSSIAYQNLSQDYSKLMIQLRAKDDQIILLKKKVDELNPIYNSPINRGNLFDDSASKQKLDQSERQIRQLKQRINQTQRKYQGDHKSWSHRQRQYIEQIRILRSEIQHLNNRMKSNFNVEGDKYYLRIEGQKLEDLIRRMENGNKNMNSKLDQILSNSRKFDDSMNSQSVVDVHVITQQNKTLIEQIRKIMRQKQQLSSVVKEYPNPDFITQYAFRIVTYFSEIHPQSAQGKCIWQQLQRIRKLNSGEQYFIILQQFTKFTLQQSAIQIYRRQLKQKAKQLELVKSRVDTFFDSELSSQKVMFQKTALTQSRIMMFRQKFMDALNVQNGNAHSNNRR